MCVPCLPRCKTTIAAAAIVPLARVPQMTHPSLPPPPLPQHHHHPNHHCRITHHIVRYRHHHPNPVRFPRITGLLNSITMKMRRILPLFPSHHSIIIMLERPLRHFRVEAAVERNRCIFTCHHPHQHPSGCTTEATATETTTFHHPTKICPPLASMKKRYSKPCTERTFKC